MSGATKTRFGSVFHALVVKEMAQDGVSGVNLWTQKGQSYGSLVNGDNNDAPDLPVV